MRDTFKIELLRCANGHGVQALTIGDTRITNSKCCGHWATVRSFKVNRESLLGAIADLDKDAP